MTISIKSPLSGVAALAILSLPTAASAQTDRANGNGLAMQAARADALLTKGKRPYYTRKFDLSGIPHYKPDRQMTGTLRIRGSNYVSDGLLADYWMKGFSKYHPKVKYDLFMKTAGGAFSSLMEGTADIGVGVKISSNWWRLYQRYFDADPLEIEFATGSYDVTGWNPAFGIVVNKANPLNEISIDQLDGIFGSERDGGWDGNDWHAEFARGPEKNIRTWGQMGLRGDWANKTINPYGLNIRYHQAETFSDRILKGSDKYNEHTRMYANFVAPNGKLSRGLAEDLAEDPNGIGYINAPTQAEGPLFNTDGGPTPPLKKLKILKVSAKPGGPYVEYTMDNIYNRTYPLYDVVYCYARSDKKHPLSPLAREFLRYVASQEGQADIVRDGKYLPLTAENAKAQLAKIATAK